MKLNCGPSRTERVFAKFARLKAWHPWFAWHPVRVGNRDCRWLETVERKGQFFGGYGGDFWEWEYRPRAEAEVIRQRKAEEELGE